MGDKDSHAVEMDADEAVGKTATPSADETTALHDDSPQPADTQSGMHEYMGGYKAHIFRRVYHVCVFTLIAPLFYWYFDDVADAMNISVPKLLSIIIIVQIIAEAVRIHFGFIIFGMREYERKQVCAQAWGTVSTCIVFLLAYPRAYSISPAFYPDRDDTTYNQRHACYAQVGLPIVWSLGFGDPLIGELKRLGFDAKQRSVIACAVLICVYVISALWCGTAWWLAIIIPPIAIAAEYPSLKVIDDNGMMLLVPLLVTLVLEPWFKRDCVNVF
jgi:hypothetical protein